VLGKSLKISGVVSTVVGVMPPNFGSFFGDPLDLWAPIDAESARYWERKDHWPMAIGRLKPGATQSQAQIEMSVIAHRLEQAYPATNKAWAPRLNLSTTRSMGVRAAISTLLWELWFVSC